MKGPFFVRPRGIFHIQIIFREVESFYKGSTKDISDRIKRHNAGYEKATKTGVPWRLVWRTQKKARSEVLKFEMKLKNLSRKKLIDFMLKYEQEVASHDELLFLKQLS
ncbi:MAG: GIY-YIG nuclease family protein [Bacteroidia bacterium]